MVPLNHWMQNRYFLVDFRYLSIWITIETPEPNWDNRYWAFYFDLSVRPIFAIHIASIWRSFSQCVDFALACTSFQSMTITTDLRDLDETCIYPAPGTLGACDLIIHFWESFIRGPAASCNNALLRLICPGRSPAYHGGA